MVQPVLLMQAVQAAIAGEDPFNIAMEIGPYPTLKGPAVQRSARTGHTVSLLCWFAQCRYG